MIERLFKPLRIGKSLLSLLAMFVMLLAPQGAWATVYTTGTLSEGSDGPKYIWAVSGTLNDFKVYASSTDAGSVTESSGSLIVNQNGCEISASGPSSVSDYFIKIFKVKIFGTNLANNKIAVKVKHYSGDVTFTASSTPGEFYLTTPEGWDSYGDELSIEVNGACTITGIEIHSTQFSSSDSYGWADTPIDGVNAINGAKQNDGSLSVNMKEHSQYTYSFSYTTKQISISSISYSSSNTSVATVADGGVVTLVGAGTAVIFATVPLDDSNSITFGYNLTVTNNAISYGLTVAGVEVTSDNFSAITGEYIQGTVSFTPAEGNDPATLTLNNATIVVEQGDEPNEFPCISYSGSNNLTIKLIGDNTVENKVGVSAIRCYSEEPGSLTFTKGNAQPCSLELSSEEETIIEGFKIVDGVNGINSVKGNFLMLTNDDNIEAHYYYFNDNDNEKYGLFTTDDEDGEIVSHATITSGYGILVTEKLVYEGNADNVLGDELENHMVKFNATNNILTLNDANLADGSINYSGTEDLTIAIDGNSKLFSINYVNDEVNDIPELTITKASGANDCSLALNSNGEGSVISGFSALNYGTFNTVSSAPISYGKIDPAENNVCLFDAVTNVWMSDVTFTTATTYPLWVGGNQVTGVNADDLFDDGGNEQTPTVSFTPANTTTTQATPATLTLNGVNYSPEDGDVTPLVVSSLDNLTVKLAGSNSVYVSSQAEVFPEAAFVSTNSDAVLTFTTNESTNLQLLNTNTIELASGFSSIAFTGYLYRDQNMVKNLLAPTPSMDNNYLQIGRAGYEPDATTFNYVIEYEDESQSVNGTYDMSKTASENNIVLDKPCTVTVFAQYGTLKSAEKVGKLFGFAQNEVSGLPGSMVDIPAIVPTIINSDGIEIGHEGVDVNETITKIDLTEASYGKTILYLYFTAGETTPYVILNKSAELRVNVIPAAPTIAFDETKTYLNSDKVTISLPTSLTGNQNATIKYSWDESCEPGNGYDYTDDGVTLNAGTNTLYAWVRYNGATADDAVYSERVSQVFTVKTDIDQFAVKDMIATDSTYTGSAIEPTFTLYDAKEPTNTLSAENYDVRIEKYVDETTDYSVVTSVLDAGTYKVYAVGKGDTYGGEKLIYEELVVNKANIQGLPTVAADDLEYNGKEQVLLPITVPDEVTVEYFFTSITKEDYNNGSYDPNCAGEVTYSTNIPKATNAGYFAIIYKVNGGNNYNNILPSGTIKVAILPAAITEVTLSENTKEYNGQAQTVTIESVKADNLVLSAEKGDYSVSYEKVEAQGTTPVDAPLEVGNYNVIVTGEGNFTGSADATFTISDRTLVVSDVTFHNGWTTYYSADGNVLLPANSNVGAFVASGVGENSVTVTQISNIPEGVAVLLNNATETTTTNVYGTDVKGNLLVHATSNKQVDPTEGDFYGLYNGVFMRVTDMFPAGKNYLLIPNAVNVNTGAPKLNIVFDNEANMTGIDEVRSKMEDVRGDVYDLQGRKVQKPSKKGLYINKGHKVVINK